MKYNKRVLKTLGLAQAWKMMMRHQNENIDGSGQHKDAITRKVEDTGIHPAIEKRTSDWMVDGDK